MKARQLIEGAVFDPQQLKAISKAFDDAWEQIAPQVSQRPEAVEAARMKLASLMLTLVKNGSKDFDKLADLAVKLTFTEPPKL
jgi:hypothetical protein